MYRGTALSLICTNSAQTYLIYMTCTLASSCLAQTMLLTTSGRFLPVGGVS